MLATYFPLSRVYKTTKNFVPCVARKCRRIQMLNTWVFKMHEALYLLKYQQHAFFFSFNPMAHKRADNQKIRCNIPPNLVANRSSDNQKVRCIFPSNLVTNKGINSQEIRNILSLVSSYTSAVLTICTTASSSFVSLG